MKKWFPIRYMRNYKFNSLFFRNFMLIETIFILPIMLICIWCYVFFSDTYLKEIESAAQSTVYRLQETADAVFDNIRITGINLCHEEKLLTFLESPENMKYDFDEVQNVVGLQKIFKQHVNEYVHSVYAYAVNNEYVITERWMGKRISMGDDSWFTCYENKKEIGGSTEWARIVVDSKADREFSSISMVFYLPYQQGKNFKGILMLNMNDRWLKNILEVDDGSFYDFYILDQQGKVAYNRDTEKQGKDIGKLMEDDGKLTKCQEGAVTLDKRYLANMKMSNNGKWKYLYLTDLQQYNKRKIQLMTTIVVVGFLMILLSVVVSFLVSVHVFLPVKKIMEMLADPKQFYDTSEEVEKQNQRDEMKFITSSFLESYKKEEQNRKELAKYVTSLKKAQIALLQAQINPHFLFNTLQSINFMVIGFTKSDNEPSKAIDKLSVMMRYMMEVDYNEVMIDKEVEYSMAYIGLEQIRYGDKLNVKWKIDPEITSYKTVKVTLQPLLENCIKHGFKNMKTVGEIEVEGKREDDKIVFLIKDNGIGQDDAWIEKMNQELRKPQPLVGRHIGIRNVNQRIQMIFGSENGLQILKVERGLTVKVIIPAKENEENII